MHPSCDTVAVSSSPPKCSLGTATIDLFRTQDGTGVRVLTKKHVKPSKRWLLSFSLTYIRKKLVNLKSK